MPSPLDIVFQEQSYFSFNSGQSAAWAHFRSIIADPCSDWKLESAGADANHCATH